VIALLAVLAAAYLRFITDGRWRWILLAAGSAVAAQWIQPFAPAVVDLGLAGVFLGVLWRRRQGLAGARRFPWNAFTGLVVIGAAQLPLLGYNLWVFQQNPFFAEFASQNVTLSPPFVYYLWGFGTYILLALPAARGFGRERSGWLAWAWLLAALCLAYLPWNLQRRFLLGATIPFAILAVMGLRTLAPVLPEWLKVRRGMAAFLLVVFTGLSSLYFAVGTAGWMQYQPEDYFDSADRVAAVDWLAGQAAPGDVILTPGDTGQLVAARAGQVVYHGHPIETLDYEVKAAAAAEFYAGNTGAAWLQEAAVDWVLVEGEVPAALQAFAQAFSAGQVSLYRLP
jgi:hypothetical protein